MASVSYTGAVAFFSTTTQRRVAFLDPDSSDSGGEGSILLPADWFVRSDLADNDRSVRRLDVIYENFVNSIGEISPAGQVYFAIGTSFFGVAGGPELTAEVEAGLKITIEYDGVSASTIGVGNDTTEPYQWILEGGATHPLSLLARQVANDGASLNFTLTFQYPVAEDIDLSAALATGAGIAASLEVQPQQVELSAALATSAGITASLYIAPRIELAAGIGARAGAGADLDIRYQQVELSAALATSAGIAASLQVAPLVELSAETGATAGATAELTIAYQEVALAASSEISAGIAASLDIQPQQVELSAALATSAGIAANLSIEYGDIELAVTYAVPTAFVATLHHEEGRAIGQAFFDVDNIGSPWSDFVVPDGVTSITIEMVGGGGGGGSDGPGSGWSVGGGNGGIGWGPGGDGGDNSIGSGSAGRNGGGGGGASGGGGGGGTTFFGGLRAPGGGGGAGLQSSLETNAGKGGSESSGGDGGGRMFGGVTILPSGGGAPNNNSTWVASSSIAGQDASGQVAGSPGTAGIPGMSAYGRGGDGALDGGEAGAGGGGGAYVRVDDAAVTPGDTYRVNIGRGGGGGDIPGGTAGQAGTGGAARITWVLPGINLRSNVGGSAGFGASLSITGQPLQASIGASAGFAVRLAPIEYTFELGASYPVDTGFAARLAVAQPVYLSAEAGAAAGFTTTLTVDEATPVELSASFGAHAGVAAELLSEAGSVILSAVFGATAGNAARLAVQNPIELAARFGARADAAAALIVGNILELEAGLEVSTDFAASLTVDITEPVELQVDFNAPAGLAVSLEVSNPNPVYLGADFGGSAGLGAGLGEYSYPGDMQASFGREGIHDMLARLYVALPADLPATSLGSHASVAARLRVWNPFPSDPASPPPADPTTGRPLDPIGGTAIDPAQPVAVTGAIPVVAWIMEISGIGTARTPYRVWSGLGQLTFEGFAWEGTQSINGAFMQLSPIVDEAGEKSTRTQAQIAVPSTVVRQMLEIDVGPASVFLAYIYSMDEGRTWIRTPVGLMGQLSRPEFEDGVYTVEIETWAGDADRGIPKVWSHETQITEHPGDYGFQFMRQLDEGIQGKWPP